MNARDTFRPPWMSGCLAGGLGYGAYRLSMLHGDLDGVASLGSLALGAMAVGQSIKAINDREKLRHYRKRLRKFRAQSSKHGRANFATTKQLQRAGLFADRGLFLGSHYDRSWRRWRDLRFNFETSGSIISGPGGGKTTSVIASTLFSDPGSHLVWDPTGEILATTYKARKVLGNEVYIVTGFASELRDVIQDDEIEIVDAGLDPYSNVYPESGNVIEEVHAANTLVVPDARDQRSDSRFFIQDAREWLDWGVLHDLDRKRHPTLPGQQDRLLAGREQLQYWLQESEKITSFGGALSRLASGLLEVMEQAPEQYAAGFGTAKQALSIYTGGSAVGRHVSRDALHPSRLKDEKRATVYVVSFGDRPWTHQPLYNLTFSYYLRELRRDPRPRRVTVLCDEAASLGYLPSLIQTMNEARKFNIRVFCAWQSLTGQVEQLYGREGVRQILEASDLLWTTAVRDRESCERLSALFGHRGEEELALNDRSLLRDASPDQGSGRSHKSIPLVRPEDIRTQPLNEAFVLCRNLRPIRCKKVYYFNRPQWRAIAGKNPYRAE